MQIVLGDQAPIVPLQYQYRAYQQQHGNTSYLRVCLHMLSVHSLHGNGLTSVAVSTAPG